MRVTAGMVARVRALAEPHWSPDGAWLAYLESFDGRGDVMLAPADGGPIRRAMQNLRTVLMYRLDREDVPADTLHQAAAILDEAAQRIERL